MILYWNILDQQRLHLIPAPEFQLSPSPLSPCRSVEPDIKGCKVEIPGMLRLPASADKPEVPTWRSNIHIDTYSDLPNADPGGPTSGMVRRSRSTRLS